MRPNTSSLALRYTFVRKSPSYACLCHQPWHTRHNHRSASAKLFADAEAEEKEELEKRSKPSRADILLEKHENWDGEERVQDAVLRMLIDKYKPLRTGQIRSADEKLKDGLPQITSKPISPDWSADGDVLELQERLGDTTQRFPSTQDFVAPPEPDQPPPSDSVPPWLVTFKVPSHAQASIKFGNFVSTPPRSIINSLDPLQSDPTSARTRAKQKAEKRFAEGAGRIDRARESTLDYRAGIRGQEGRSRPNPVSMRGWNALIEERIQKAQATGMFDKIEGRGKPFQRTSDEMNPFVAREEFLMNRIVRKNDAAPPWVELQKDAEKATTQLRELLLSGWTRRMLRMLPLSYPATMLENLTPESVSKLRDEEWERQEEKYHDAAVREANDVIRRYNTVAPYIVRRPLLTRQAELARCYKEAGSLIVAGIQARASEGKHAPTPGEDVPSTPSRSSAGTGWDLRRLLDNAVKQLYTRFSRVVGRRMY